MSKRDGPSGSSDPTAGDASVDDPRVLAAVQEYLAAVEAGRRPNRRELLARHPEIAAELSACLQGLALVQSAAAEIGRGSPAQDHQVAADELPADSQPLGDFRLIREIGRGGMGVVYEAVQLSLGRRVALKVLPLAGALDPRQLQRFRNEAQAAAQLHHTNIVPVYAVGYERSVHFYAMQLIEGQSLAEVIAELRQTSGRDSVAIASPPDETQAKSGPATSSAGVRGVTADEAERDERRRSLDADGRSGVSLPRATESLSAMFAGPKRHSFFQRVAQLGMQAAEALDYAHQLGVVHRDIKPANLLLDVQGTIWIADFGLAQLQGDAGGGGLTQPGDLLGTLRYMSPEQASGQAVVLDQRTDVYSLGVTLYELLTLERALPGQTRDQLLHQIGYVDPRPPRSIDRAIPPELETILAKAMAKDAAERYPTAKALADDLRRFLANEPIQARPPTPWDRAVKWSRRHKSIAVSAIVTLLITSGVLLVSTVLIARRADEVREQRERADKSLRQAVEVVDYFTDAVEELPKDARYLRLRQDWLQQALSYYQTFLDERRDDPAIEADLWAARGKAASLLGEVEAVGRLFRTMHYVSLLDETSVRADLKLTDQQAALADALPGEVRQEEDAERAAASQPSVPIFRRPLDQREPELAKETDRRLGKLERILTVEQLDRLRQISRQVRGLAMFRDDDVLKVLALRPEQRQEIERFEGEFRKQARDAPGGGDLGGRVGPGGPRGAGPGAGGPNEGPRGRDLLGGGPPPPPGSREDLGTPEGRGGGRRGPFAGPKRDGRGDRDGPPRGRRPDREAVRDRVVAAWQAAERARREAAVAQLVANLKFDAAQNAAWQKLVGARFGGQVGILDEFGGPPGFGGGPGRPDGPGREGRGADGGGGPGGADGFRRPPHGPGRDGLGRPDGPHPDRPPPPTGSR